MIAAPVFFILGLVSVIYGSIVVHGVFNDPFVLFYYLIAAICWGLAIVAALTE